MKLTEITSYNDLLSIKNEWYHLSNNCFTSTPFQTPSWLMPWWDTFGFSTLKTVALRENGKLMGLGVFFIYSSPISNRRVLCFAGNGLSDYSDILAIHGTESICQSEILHYIFEISDEWDECDLQDIPQNGIMLLNSTVPKSISRKVSVCNICPFLLLPQTLEQLDLNLTKKLRKNIHRAERELTKKGSISLHLTDQESLESNLDICLYLQHNRLKQKHIETVIDDSLLKMFFKKVTSEMFKNNLLQIYLLKLDMDVIAAYYVLQQHPLNYAYICGYDQNFEEFSPGTLALYEIIKQAIKNNVEIFDFMRGSEHYKYHWNPFTNFNYRLKFYKK